MKISVITTTYNRKQLLLQTIESVAQSILTPLVDVDFEHIIYDDGSTDGTEEIFKTNSYPHVVYIQSKENKGPSFGRNKAIEQATGDYLFLIDSDDIILQRTLYNFVNSALKNPSIDWFVSDFIRVDADLKYELGNDYYHWKFKNPKEALTAIFKGEHFIQSNVFFKKELFKLVGGFDENMKMAEDLDLFTRFYIRGSMPLFTDFISHLHRNHSTNISSNINRHEHMTHVNKIKEKHKDELRKHGII